MKRIISFLIVIMIFILNCVPVFAWQDSDFLFTGNETIPTELVDFMTENPGYNYYYVFGRRNGSNFKILLYSVSSFSVARNEENDYLLTYTNNTGDQISVYSTLSDFGQILEPYQVLDFNYGGDRCYYWVEYMVSKNNNCVNSQWCSPNVYVEENPDDYEEDGVVIKGLTSFFNNMINGLKNVVDSILELPEKILNGLVDLFVPDIENMKVLFNEFLDYMTAKFGFNDLIETLQGLVDSVGDEGSTVGAADIKETFTYNIGDSDFNFEFSIPFSDFYNSIVKNEIGGYMKGIFFLLLIFYNLSELYFLIRGVRPWKDPQITMMHNEMERDNINSYIAHRKGGGYGI